jgi:arylsulfatase
MSITRLPIVFAAALLAGLANLPAATPTRPNILIILADDLGWSDLGCYGGEIRTPNLDALAAGGLRFTQFYTSARCCPSRASLLTGLYPHQTGVGLMTSDQGARFPGAGDSGNAFPGYRGAINESCVTIAQVLKPAGYRTAAVGKWHVGDRETPTKRGFDDFYGYVGGYAVDSWEPRMMVRLPAGKPARTYGPGEYFATDAITDHALDFMADMRKSGAPWLLYVGYQVAHFPIASRRDDMAGYPAVYAQGWDKIREQRLARQKKIGLLPADAPLTPRSKIPHVVASNRMGSMTADGNNPAWDSLPADRRADLAQRMAVYAGMVTGMDRNVGRLVADLRASGQFDNTLIFFLSDNGACAEWDPKGFDGRSSANNVLHRGGELESMGGPGTYHSAGSGWANASNTPWRLYKHYVHEGGISSPCIMHWPEGFRRRGAIEKTPAHLIDLMPTLVEASGAGYPERLGSREIIPMAGRSLIPALRGQRMPTRALYFEHEGHRAVREGRYKLTALRGEPWRLFDMDGDRTEMEDLAGKHPMLVQSLAKKWDVWAAANQVTPLPQSYGVDYLPPR